ncbi:hypothetical protein BG015_007144 [Linnemannia schmuckeri]|uniref:WD40 repeat-like protein n=1 Tax=Linnemannia schmuckeri TaxID=64567 RepID=A0A9P5S159_9FUNG|nr:hypothetical protein BG015_007144 [Linnemannia schmuckeri]
MSSSPPPGSLPTPSTPPTSTFSEHSELTTDGTSNITTNAQVQLGTSNMLNPLGHHAAGHATTGSINNQFSDSNSISSKNSSELSVRKRVSRFLKGHSKTNDTITTAPVSPSPAGAALTEPALSELSSNVEAIISQADVTAVTLDSDPLIQRLQFMAATPTIAIIQVERTSVIQGVPNPGIFSKNVAAPALTTDLPRPSARIEKTTQLVYCYSLLTRAQALSSSSASGVADTQTIALDESQLKWVQQVEPFEQDEMRRLIEQLAEEFVADQIKAHVAIAEVVLVGPILEHEIYRSLLSSFISEFERNTLIDIVLLQGLVQLVECASEGYLVDDDLVRIAAVLSKELAITHTGTSDHTSYLTWTLSRVLDVMVSGKVKGLNRNQDHQPMLQLLRGLRDSDNVCLKHQAAYAYQALQYVPDDETPLEIVWRYAQLAAASASSVSSVFKLNPAGLLESLESLQKFGASVAEAVMAGMEGYQGLRDGTGKIVRASEKKFDFMEKRSWYLALQGTSLFIQQGRLADFREVVCQAPCRHDVDFQWGICRQLGETAVDSLWDASTRQQAIDFLGALYRSDIDWKLHTEIKRWIMTILVQISQLSDPETIDHALAVLDGLEKGANTALEGSYPLSVRLLLPDAFPLLTRVQEIPRVDYKLHTLKKQRMDEYKQSIYISPMAKPSLQAPDDNLFPLMQNVMEFLESDRQVMLILGDSGVGKSTFNRYLEHQLWQGYKTGDRIPLFISLPSLYRPERELVTEQLETLNFSDEQIRELKLHRRFTLICDGYDESQLTSNLHATNFLNQLEQWDTKLIITCRSQYLGSDYRHRFAPKADGPYYCSADNLFHEVVITPFSYYQIEEYVEQYVPLEPRPWFAEDYMDKLTTIPNLMDLVKNPFLLSLCLEALPSVIEGETDLSRLQVTRVQLYDNFVGHWMAVNKRRLQDLKLSEKLLEAYEALLDNGFEKAGIEFQQDLAAAIFRKQDGRPVVDYIPRRDKDSWKAEFFGPDPEATLLRDASLLSRAARQFRFVHRSILEYFYSCTIFMPINNTEEIDPQYFSKSNIPNFSIADHPLSRRILVTELPILQFLADRVHSNPNFRQHLNSLIERSKTDEQADRAAANAITILVKAGIRFNGADLRGIRIPGADVSTGKFDTAQLQGADLTGVNFAKSWIRQTDFTGAQMEEAQFGELAYLKMPDRVCSCAYSPDGKSVVGGLNNGDIIMYDTTTWTQVKTFQGHEGTVSSLEFTASGHQLLSASSDNTVRLWDKETGRSLLGLEGHSGAVTAATFSPSGKQIASGSDDKSIRLWDAHSSPATSVSIDHGSKVSSVTYSPDGLHVASSGDDGVIRVFDILTGLPKLTMDSGSRLISCITYSPDGQCIVSGDDNGELQFWTTVDGQPGPKWEGHPSLVLSVTFSSNGHWIASSSYDYTVKLWSAQTGGLVYVFSGHSYFVYDVAFSPDSSLLVSSGYDSTVRIWQMNSVEAVLDSSNIIDTLYALAYSPNGQHLLIPTQDGHLRLYDASTGAPSLALSSGQARVEHVAYSPDGLRLATVESFSNEVKVWDAKTGQVDFTLHCQTEDDGMKKWKCRTKIPDFSRTVQGIAWRPGTLEFVTGSGDGSVRVWKLKFESSTLVVQLLWNTGPASLVATGAAIADTVGLSDANRRLLLQRGATDGS